MVTREKISYGGWANVYRLANEQVDLYITADVGPRILRYGFIGQPNEFREVAEHQGQTGGNEWRSYGGHRLWHAPEQPQRTYAPDNDPVTVQPLADGVHVIQPVEALTGIQKELVITLDPHSSRVQVVHRLTNRNLWSVELAPWALTVMAAGGVGILPQPPKGSHRENLTPVAPLVLWAYTNMADPRWTWGEHFILLRQDSTATVPQKVGLAVQQGWAAYARNGHLFIKTFTPQPHAPYPDLGASVEIFTNQFMLEVETLAPLVTLAPNATVEHTEQWYLFEGVTPPQTDEDVQREIVPKLPQ